MVEGLDQTNGSFGLRGGRGSRVELIQNYTIFNKFYYALHHFFSLFSESKQTLILELVICILYLY